MKIHQVKFEAGNIEELDRGHLVHTDQYKTTVTTGEERLLVCYRNDGDTCYYKGVGAFALECPSNFDGKTPFAIHRVYCEGTTTLNLGIGQVTKEQLIDLF